MGYLCEKELKNAGSVNNMCHFQFARHGRYCRYPAFGEQAVIITDKVFKSPKKDKKLIEQPANTLHFGQIVFVNEVIDEVVVAIFRAPHSFTGEDMLRFHATVRFISNRKSWKF
jgi:hypothetical protein